MGSELVGEGVLKLDQIVNGGAFEEQVVDLKFK